MALIAEWISQELSTLIYDILKECLYKETMDLLGNQVWNDMTEEWVEFLCGESNSPSL